MGTPGDTDSEQGNVGGYLRAPVVACMTFAVALLLLAGAVLISGRSPGLWILVLLIPILGWIALSQRLAGGYLAAVVDHRFFWPLLGVFQAWPAWLIAEWIAHLTGMNSQGSVYAVFSFAVLLAFLGAAALIYRSYQQDRLTQ
jgi:hypothetical protein